MYFFNSLRKMFHIDCLYEVDSTQKNKEWKKIPTELFIILFTVWDQYCEKYCL